MITLHDIDEIETGDVIGYTKTDAIREQEVVAMRMVAEKSPLHLQSFIKERVEEYESKETIEKRKGNRGGKGKSKNKGKNKNKGRRKKRYPCINLCAQLFCCSRLRPAKPSASCVSHRTTKQWMSRNFLTASTSSVVNVRVVC
jgi:hypothetical protein